MRKSLQFISKRVIYVQNQSASRKIFAKPPLLETVTLWHRERRKGLKLTVADVGCGQGIALSPLLSPWWLFLQHSVSLSVLIPLKTALLHHRPPPARAVFRHLCFFLLLVLRGSAVPATEEMSYRSESKRSLVD